MSRNFSLWFSPLVVLAGFASPLLSTPPERISLPQFTESIAPLYEVPDPLPRGALLRLGAFRLRHCEGLGAVSFSPDGKLIATIGRDHAVCLWDRATGKLLHRIQEDNADYQVLGFSPDSKQLVLAYVLRDRCEGCFMKMYEVDSGDFLRKLSGHEQPIYQIAFMPDGNSFFSISCDQLIRWDAATGRALQQRSLDWPTGVVAVAPQHRLLVFASSKREDPFIRIIDLLTGKEKFSIQGELKTVAYNRGTGKGISKAVKPEQPIVSLAVSPDGKIIASGSPFECIRLWDSASGKLLQCLADMQGGISLCFSPDGKMLASGSMNGLVRFWDVATGKEIRKLEGYKGWVNMLAYSPDGKMLAMAGADARTLHLWEVQTGKDLRYAQGHLGQVHALAFSGDGRYLASASSDRADEDKTIRLWDTVSGKELFGFGEPHNKLLCLAFSPDGTKLVFATEQEPLPRLVPVKTGKTIEYFQPEAKKKTTDYDFRIMTVAFSPDGRFLAGGTTDGQILLWETATGKYLRSWRGHLTLITSVAFSPDGQQLLSASEDRSLRLWDAGSGKELKLLAKTEDTFRGLTFSPDGKLAAAQSIWWEGKVYLWNLETGKDLKRIPLAKKKINQIAFSPNGKMLALGDVDGAITLFEVATGKPRASFRGHLSEITALRFSHDGSKLATGSGDTTILVWDVTAGSMPKLIPISSLSTIHLNKLWQDLASDDPSLAYKSMWKLVASPEQADSFLRSRIKPRPVATPKQIQALIEDLDHPGYGKRAQAMQQLVELGKPAESFLREALQHKNSAEVNERLKLLLTKLETVQLSTEQIRTERALETLEWIGTKNISNRFQAKLQGR